MVVVEEVEVAERFSSLAQPAREASAKDARQEKINVEGRMDVFVIFINVSLRQEPTSPMGCTPHDAGSVIQGKQQAVKIGPKKKSLKPGKIIACGYAVRDHGHIGMDADHVPVIPGNDFAPGIVGGMAGQGTIQSRAITYDKVNTP